MASRFGYPCSIMDDAVFMRTPPATEQVSPPPPNHHHLSRSLTSPPTGPRPRPKHPPRLPGPPRPARPTPQAHQPRLLPLPRPSRRPPPHQPRNQLPRRPPPLGRRHPRPPPRRRLAAPPAPTRRLPPSPALLGLRHPPHPPVPSLCALPHHNLPIHIHHRRHSKHQHPPYQAPPVRVPINIVHLGLRVRRPSHPAHARHEMSLKPDAARLSGHRRGDVDLDIGAAEARWDGEAGDVEGLFGYAEGDGADWVV